ncbi:hypothetical protein ABID23_000978 [Bartonella silvatica]|uniref:Uncharacterized protein n=1 Tax=Bartonella silvatica TaxID=357760 RepID=A0ABV2HH55_9HYPH
MAAFCLSSKMLLYGFGGIVGNVENAEVDAEGM